MDHPIIGQAPYSERFTFPIFGGIRTYLEVLQVRAVYDYAGTLADELSFALDDEITIEPSVGLDAGWMRGRLASGATGIFPGYTDICSESVRGYFIEPVSAGIFGLGSSV